MDRLVYSKFAMYKVDEDDLESVATYPFPFIDGSQFRAVTCGVDEPACQINFEDWLPGPDIAWTLFHDEVQYVIRGRAEIEVWHPPLMQDHVKVVAEPGCVYLLPRGARVVWRVLGDEPFRHLCICFPNPGYPNEMARSAQAAQARSVGATS